MTATHDILIVDDDADLRAAVAIVLVSEGRQVAEAANGQLALDALASGHDFGVIVLDLMMPVMDGTTFLAHKATGVHARIPVVIFSASAGDDLYGFAGVSSVVPKLTGIDALLSAIRQAEAAAPPSIPAGALHV